MKVYKTSVLVFKDRDRYVTGEHRWRRGYCKSNPRKMVKLWAEKEMRNLKRLNAAGVPSPTPLLLKAHVLLMTFVGDDGKAAPRLKDVQLSGAQMREAYHQAVRLLRAMYHQCRLVHADLSEFNLLWHRQALVVIDVSQSVEHDHPHALTFLRKDISNVNRFFAQGGAVDVLSDRRLFSFVLEPGLSAAEEDARMEQMMSEQQRDGAAGAEGDDFLESFVPRRLDEVEDYEAEYERTVGGSDSALHAAIRAMTVDAKHGEERKEYDGGSNEGEEAEDSEASSDDDSDDSDGALLAEDPSLSSRLPAAPPAPRLSAAERRAREHSKHARRSRQRRGEEDEVDVEGREVEHEEEGAGEDSDEESEESSEQSDDDSADDETAAEEPTASSDAPVHPLSVADASSAASAREVARAERKSAKKIAKAAQAEKRKTKIKKKDKKRKVKATSRVKH